MTEQRIDESPIFSDESAQFRRIVNTNAGDQVILRFRMEKNRFTGVYYLTESETVPMMKVSEDERFSLYETTRDLRGEKIYYGFLAVGEDFAAYYDRKGIRDVSEPKLLSAELSGDERPFAKKTLQALGFSPKTAFRVFPGYAVPGWMEGAVAYQIFVDRFCNGDPENDVQSGEYVYNQRPVVRVSDWNEPPQTEDVHRFYGGDLKGVAAKLDYLQRLGVEVIYFNPLFLSPSNHKYDCQDYEHIDPHFVGFVDDAEGADSSSSLYCKRVTSEKNLHYADAYFAKLCEEIHRRGMKIILDGVFNHAGSFHKWMDREGLYRGKEGCPAGAYWDEKSPYHGYFHFSEDAGWPDHVTYKGWWDFETLPKLNYEGSEELCGEILKIARKWVSAPYFCDGWRLDVAADLGETEAFNHTFWKRFRAAVREANPNALILAEHYGDPSSWLQGDEWDTVMNYDGFMEPVTYFLTGLDKHSKRYRRALHGNGAAFFEALKNKMLLLPEEARTSAMNELSNHDHSRFLTRTNRVTGTLATRGSRAASEGLSYATYKEAAVMQFTLPGAPTIYYGDEAGQVGWTDPDSRRTYPWGHENWELIAFHKDLASLHKRYSCLRRGSFLPLTYDYGFVSYGRFDEDSAVLVLVNHSEQGRKVYVPVYGLGIPDGAVVTREMVTNEIGYNVGRKAAATSEGWLCVPIDGWSAAVYTYRK